MMKDDKSQLMHFNENDTIVHKDFKRESIDENHSQTEIELKYSNLYKKKKVNNLIKIIENLKNEIQELNNKIILEKTENKKLREIIQNSTFPCQNPNELNSYHDFISDSIGKNKQFSENNEKLKKENENLKSFLKFNENKQEESSQLIFAQKRENKKLFEIIFRLKSSKNEITDFNERSLIDIPEKFMKIEVFNLDKIPEIHLPRIKLKIITCEEETEYNIKSRNGMRKFKQEIINESESILYLQRIEFQANESMFLTHLLLTIITLTLNIELFLVGNHKNDYSYQLYPQESIACSFMIKKFDLISSCNQNYIMHFKYVYRFK